MKKPQLPTWSRRPLEERIISVRFWVAAHFDKLSAGVVQLVERLVANEKVAGAHPVSRSHTKIRPKIDRILIISSDVKRHFAIVSL